MTGTANIPWKTLPSELGDVPFYIIEFDKNGNCTSPNALEHLIGTSEIKTDVVLFSHGWNNDWNAATSRYDRFVHQFIDVRHQRWRPPTRAFAPVLVGVFWPSAALVAPWEQGPDIAVAMLPDADVAALAEALPPDQKNIFLALVANPSAGDVTQLATMLAPVVSQCINEVDSGEAAVTAEDVLAVWNAVATADAPSSTGLDGGFIDDGGASAGGAPAAAGWNPIQLIRDGIRATTVLLMKDRAGRVGGNGVSRMLHRLADTSAARISLVGHSYGCKVVLSALCNGPAPSRVVDSVLLLEPALSCFAFADDIDGHAGGYHSALQRVRQPIITTHSANDVPLTKFFHLAVRRNSDLAEAVIAGQPPSKFAAMGGYGPAGVATDWIDMPAVGDSYPLSTDMRVIAANGTRYIASHGAVETPETAWALLSQIRA